MRINFRSGKQNSILNIIISGILLFLYIYEFNFVYFGLPTFVTSRRLVVLILAFIVLTRSLVGQTKNLRIEIPPRESSRSIFRVSALQLFLLIYVLLIYLVIGKGTGEMVSNSILRLLLFGIVPIFLFYLYFDSLDGLMRAVLIATILQSLIIIACLASPAFQTRLDTIFALESDYVAIHRSEYAGGLACITAPGALKFCIGLVACAYFLLKKKSGWFMALYLALSLMATMIARTGLFIAAAGMLVFLLYFAIEERNFRFFWVLLSIVLVIAVTIILFNYFDLWSFFAQRLTRFQKLSGGLYEGFFDAYFHESGNYIPELSLETWFGTGIVSGAAGNGVFVNADGGFLRLYVAFGLPLCIVFYLHLAYHMVRQIRFTKEKFVFYSLIFFAITMLMAEIKEYTLYNQYMICLFFAAAALSKKDVIQSNEFSQEVPDEKL